MESFTENVNGPAVQASNLTRVHRLDGVEIRSLDRVSLNVVAGEVVALVGPSGAGKTSLLHLLGGLDPPDEGTIRIAGTDWGALRGDDRAHFRRRTCGFVVQGEALLPQATAAENVEIPLVLAGIPASERRERVGASLELVGLAEHAAKLPGQLSVGQQQRAAIARAMVTQPAVLLADEPTGSLDSVNARQVARLMIDAAHARGTAVVLVTHDPDLAAGADRVLRMHSGRIDDAPTKVR